MSISCPRHNGTTSYPCPQYRSMTPCHELSSPHLYLGETNISQITASLHDHVAPPQHLSVFLPPSSALLSYDAVLLQTLLFLLRLFLFWSVENRQGTLHWHGSARCSTWPK